MMLSLIMPTVDSNYIAFVFVYHRHCLSPMPLLCCAFQFQRKFRRRPRRRLTFYFSISANRPEQCRCSDAKFCFLTNERRPNPSHHYHHRRSGKRSKLKWKTLKFSRGMRWLWWHFVFAADTFVTRSDDVSYWLWEEIRKKNVRSKCEQESGRRVLMFMCTRHCHSNE